jgi:CheY-like chemotaxis protein
MNGCELLKYTRSEESLAGTPFIMMTADPCT